MLPLYNQASRPQQRTTWLASFVEPRRQNIFVIAGLVILSFTLVLILLINTDMGAAEEEALLKQVGDVVQLKPVTSSHGSKPLDGVKSPQGTVKEIYEHQVDEHPEKYGKEEPIGAGQNKEKDKSTETKQEEQKEGKVVSGDDAENSNRRNAVIEAFKDSYSSYRRYCPNDDELQPVSKQCRRWFNLGLTRIDALDTMWLMGLKDEFNEAVQWINEHFKIEQDITVSVFEAMIRITGGLLSAYDLSGDKSLLDKAKDFTDRLMPTFSAEPSGIPRSVINLKNRRPQYHSWLSGRVALAEVATVQMELAYLSHHTNDPKYGKAGLRIFKTLQRHAVEKGLYGVFLNPDGSSSNTKLTLNAPADSAYEYIFKTHLLLGKKVKWLEEMWEDTAKAVLTRLRATDGDLVYAGVREGDRIYGQVEQLACFAGGLFALSSKHAPTSEDASSRLQFGADFTRFCREMYHQTPTGLAPEIVSVSAGKIHYGGQLSYQLRPETVESLFYLFRTTGDRKYRDWAWEIFQSIQKHCKVSTGGYSGIHNVQDASPTQDDTQHSWFLAETLKYFFLIFSDPSVVPLDKYVFNTEAHPLSIFDPNPEMYTL